MSVDPSGYESYKMSNGGQIVFNGWVLKVGKLTLRIMTEGGGRVNYFRLSHATKGAMTILGAFSGDRALTHINVTFGNIIQIVATILKFRLCKVNMKE